MYITNSTFFYIYLNYSIFKKVELNIFSTDFVTTIEIFYFKDLKNQ